MWQNGVDPSEPFRDVGDKNRATWGAFLTEEEEEGKGDAHRRRLSETMV